tara:strand:- start:25 stop:192 length:168 start_codon:yes stop_codon:yes gene_type:complete
MDDKNFLREIVDDEITPKRKKLEEFGDLHEINSEDGLDYEVDYLYGKDFWKKESK